MSRPDKDHPLADMYDMISSKTVHTAFRQRGNHLYSVHSLRNLLQDGRPLQSGNEPSPYFEYKKDSKAPVEKKFDFAGFRVNPWGKFEGEPSHFTTMQVHEAIRKQLPADVVAVYQRRLRDA